MESANNQKLVADSNIAGGLRDVQDCAYAVSWVPRIPRYRSAIGETCGASGERIITNNLGFLNIND